MHGAARDRFLARPEGSVDHVPRRDFNGIDGFSDTIGGLDGSGSTAEVSIGVAVLDEDLGVARLVAYLFEAGLGRKANVAGLNHRAGRVISGSATEEELACAFPVSDEFTARAGRPADSLSDRQLVEQLFLNVLERPGAEGGIESWEAALKLPGFAREDLLIAFAESPENLLGSPEIAAIEEIEDGMFVFLA